MTEDYAVKIGVRNGRILARMKELGIETQRQLEQLSGVSFQQLNGLITMRLPACRKNGEWSDNALRLAFALKCEPDDLFNNQQREQALSVRSVEIYMSEERVTALVGGSPEAAAWAKIEANRLIDCLNDRQKFVIQERLDGATFQEISEKLNLSINMVRIIEAKAHRKMKLASYRSDGEFKSKMIAGMIDG